MSVRKRVHPPRALTIAGSDSGGGAGIQADLKTFAALGVHGMSAITSITAQNTFEVRGIQDVTPEIVGLQIDAVAQDIGVDAAKTGMLSSSDIVRVVAEKVKTYGFPLVVDPVMIAKSGARLLREDAISTLVGELIPLATVVTPNRMEAEVLSGIKISTLDDAKRAAKKIIEEHHPKVVVIKGGHISGDESTDVVFDGREYRTYSAPRIPEDEGCTHGTGCSFSAAITAFIAWGNSEFEAIRRAKEFVTGAIRYSYKIGRGHCPVNPIHYLEKDAERYRVVASLYRALEKLNANASVSVKLVPESRTNVVMSLPAWYVLGESEIAGFPGRLTVVENRIVHYSPPEFGIQDSMVRLLYEAISLDWRARAAMNIAYSSEFVEKAEKMGFKVFTFDWKGKRAEEGVRESLPLKKASEALGGRLPDFIAEVGCFGREEQILVFDESAESVVEKVLKVAKQL
uniref:Bifunctional hydroxymethylpyrimidine kinase/phosphomethylpyrimidine kinase n=1 Tax=Fervidicoccus fontis TaxID=683846 RepID=A0A7J3ZIV8_9CREN